MPPTTGLPGVPDSLENTPGGGVALSLGDAVAAGESGAGVAQTGVMRPSAEKA